MSGVQLLDKTRKIGKLLHNSNQGKVIFNDICKVLCETLSSNVLVISRKGKVLGMGKSAEIDTIEELISNKHSAHVSDETCTSEGYDYPYDGDR